MAKARMDKGIDAYERTEETSTTAEAGKIEIENFSCNKLAIVRWSEIREESEEV